MEEADRTVMLTETAAVLDLIEAAAGTQLPTPQFHEATVAMVALSDDPQAMLRMLYNLARLCAWNMRTAAAARGETFAEAMQGTRLALMQASDG